MFDDLSRTRSADPIFLSAEACAGRYAFSPEHWRRLVDAGKAPTRYFPIDRWACWTESVVSSSRPTRATHSNAGTRSVSNEQ